MSVVHNVWTFFYSNNKDILLLFTDLSKESLLLVLTSLFSLYSMVMFIMRVSSLLYN